MAARRRADPKGSDGGPWYRTPAATFAAGGFGAVLVGALVVTVVQMSGQWSSPSATLVTTPAATPVAPATSRESKQPFVITPSDVTTSFTTSVPLSTTDIGVPPVGPSDTTTSSSETTTSTTTATSTTTSRTAEKTDEEPTTTRRRPRYNETRTFGPGH